MSYKNHTRYSASMYSASIDVSGKPVTQITRYIGHGFFPIRSLVCKKVPNRAMLKKAGTIYRVKWGFEGTPAYPREAYLLNPDLPLLIGRDIG